MKVALLSRNPLGWVSRSLEGEFSLRGHCTRIVPIRTMVMGFLTTPIAFAGGHNLVDDFDVAVLRVLGPDSLEEALHTIGLLRFLESHGQLLVNSEVATRNCLNKLSTIDMLSASGIAVPRTFIVRHVDEGLRAFGDIGDAVIKPIFGSRGEGVTRATNVESARFVLEEMLAHGRVPLIQEFIRHEGFDIRALVVGDVVIASMRRESKGLRTNISRGGKPMPIELGVELSGLAVRASRALGCDYAGVDIVSSDKGNYVLEVNSQPDYRALQCVSGVNISASLAALVEGRAVG